MRNSFVTTVTLKRIEICDLLLACLAASDASNGAEKWDRLHEKLARQLDLLDAQLDDVVLSETR